MAIRALLLGDRECALIERVVKHAFRFPVSLTKVKETIAGTEPPVGDNPEFCCIIPNGFRCVFSFEEQPHGWCRHLSISIPTVDGAPSPIAVEMLMPAFGFTGKLTDCYVWVTRQPHFCVEVLQLVTDEDEKGQLVWNMTYRTMKEAKREQPLM